MIEKILLHLLILCGVLYHGIIVSSSNDNREESSALLAREKRVINTEPGGNQRVRIEDVKYMTNIKENNQTKCVGVILSDYSVITASQCVRYQVSLYKVQSGSTYQRYCKNHIVTSKAIFYGNHPRGDHDGIALLTVDPPFTFGPKTGSIQLYSGPLQAGTLAAVSGCGFMYPLVRQTGLCRGLRQITIPIINHAECLNAYRTRFMITHKHICTYDRQKHCAYTDFGAPLVINNKLAGIHTFKGEFRNQINPDVFIDLQLPEYRSWIIRNTLLI